MEYKYDASTIWSEIQWGDQPDEIPYEMSQSEYRQLLIYDMLKILNKYREYLLIPTQWICVDK